MTDNKLVKHLRSSANRLVNYAADRIVALIAERDQLGRELNVAKYGQPDFAWSVHLEVMAELQAERDRFRKVLERVASLMHDEYNPYSIEGMVGDAARAALKGETP